MPDYSKGKIYKLQCDDGHYYIGSTCNELRKRLWLHKTESRTTKSRVYNHINEIGWNSVRMILVEEYSCENKDQLRSKEDTYINRNDNLCLNMTRAVLSLDERIHKQRDYNRRKKLSCKV